jgi:hypothetical protein
VGILWPRSLPYPQYFKQYPNGATYTRAWYNDEPQCFWDNTNQSTIIQSANNYRGMVCDEYPYASTAQGGYLNYQLNHVSLRLVPDHEQLRNVINNSGQSVDNVGSQYWKIGEFYENASVVRLHPSHGWFGVGTISNQNSFWRDRQGQVHTFNEFPV